MLTPAVSAFHDAQDLARLRLGAQQHDPAALEETSVQFEALIVGMMLKASREASLGEGILDNAQTRQYLDLMDRQVAMELARKGGLGFGRMLIEGVEDVWGGSGDGAGRVPADPNEFVAEVMAAATGAARRLGVDPELLIAQSALETGWGRSLPAHGDGRSAFNFFGIKAGGDWDGPRVVRNTLEFVDGIPERRQERFRAYATAEDAFSDYADLVQESPRYASAMAAGSPEEYARGLAEGGYATDPDYAQKWLAIYHGDTLRNAVGQLKAPLPAPTQ